MDSTSATLIRISVMSWLASVFTFMASTTSVMLVGWSLPGGSAVAREAASLKKLFDCFDSFFVLVKLVRSAIALLYFSAFGKLAVYPLS